MPRKHKLAKLNTRQIEALQFTEANSGWYPRPGRVQPDGRTMRSLLTRNLVAVQERSVSRFELTASGSVTVKQYDKAQNVARQVNDAVNSELLTQKRTGLTTENSIPVPVDNATVNIAKVTAGRIAEVGRTIKAVEAMVVEQKAAIRLQEDLRRQPNGSTTNPNRPMQMQRLSGFEAVLDNLLLRMKTLRKRQKGGV